jgi:hypothetical protein
MSSTNAISFSINDEKQVNQENLFDPLEFALRNQDLFTQVIVAKADLITLPEAAQVNCENLLESENVDVRDVISYINERATMPSLLDRDAWENIKKIYSATSRVTEAITNASVVWEEMLCEDAYMPRNEMDTATWTKWRSVIHEMVQVIFQATTYQTMVDIVEAVAESDKWSDKSLQTMASMLQKGNLTARNTWQQCYVVAAAIYNWAKFAHAVNKMHLATARALIAKHLNIGTTTTPTVVYSESLRTAKEAIPGATFAWERLYCMITGAEMEQKTTPALCLNLIGSVRSVKARVKMTKPLTELAMAVMDIRDANFAVLKVILLVKKGIMLSPWACDRDTWKKVEELAVKITNAKDKVMNILSFVMPSVIAASETLCKESFIFFPCPKEWKENICKGNQAMGHRNTVEEAWLILGKLIHNMHIATAYSLIEKHFTRNEEKASRCCEAALLAIDGVTRVVPEAIRVWQKFYQIASTIETDNRRNRRFTGSK